MARSEAVATANANEHRFSGREAELAALGQALDEALRAKAFRVALVRGPEGVGRTALLKELSRRWADRGLTLASNPAQGPLLKQLAASLAREQLTLDSMGRQRAAVWLVDDLDALDVEDQGALASYLRGLLRPPALRAVDEALSGGLIVFGVGERRLSTALQGVLDSARPTVFTLAPLDAEGVRRYLSQGGLADRLFEATGGVPARIEELISGQTVDFAEKRLARLSGADRDLLNVLAALAGPESARFVAAVTGQQGVGERLKSLADAGWVAASPDLGKTHFGLARESDRRALLTAVPIERLRRIHLAVAESYALAGNDEAAFRAFCSAAARDGAVVTGLRLADRQIAQSALVAAEETLTRLEQLPLERPERRGVQLRLADVLERRGEIRRALAALGRGRAASDDVTERRSLRARTAKLCVSIGAIAPAERIARVVLADEPRSLDAMCAFADARFLRGAYEEVLAFVERHERLAPAERVPLENIKGKALLTLGRLDAARTTFQDNATRAESAGLPVERCRALLNVGVVAHRQGARDEARRAYATALAGGEVPFTPVIRANLASLHFEEGEVEQAIAEAHRALASFGKAGRAKEESHAMQNLARFYLFAGDGKRAAEIAALASEGASRVGDPYLMAGARLVAAEAVFRGGEAGGTEALTAIAAEFERLGNQRYRNEAQLLVVEGRLQAGDVAGAGDALASANIASFPALAPEWHLLNAEVALRSGDDDRAADSLRSAREGLVSAPHVELPARLYSLAAQLADRRGDRGLAQAERLKALSILERLASKVPLELRGLFFARAGRRAIVEQAGRLLPEAPRATGAVAAAPVVALLGRAPSILRLNQLIDRIGPSSATVLIRGESGTGKELVARALHERSPRRDLPLVAVNCGALSEELLLSELFGHERGAFTGAIRDRKGRFELAAGGTIFLDEIGDISPRAQVALLRVLQERTFERVGGTRTLSVDVRVVCATNRPLEELMKKGQFREDLYYRLRGTTLTLPPLRERAEDVEVLCEAHLSRLANERGEATPRRLSREVLGMLQQHGWPGNVRELINVLESVSLLAHGETIEPDAFELFPELFPATPAPVRTPRPLVRDEQTGAPDFYSALKARDLSLKDFRRELDLACISEALQEASGNISEAARLLKMKRSRLSQVVNAEPTLRVLCRGPVNDGGGDDGEDEDGPILAGDRRRNGAVE